MISHKINCEHENKKISKIQIPCYSFCLQCGALLYSQKEKTYFPIAKPLSFQYETEINPVNLYKCLLPQTNTPFTEPSAWYSANRVRVVAYLQQYIQIYKYSEQTFHLALYYVDWIMITKNKIVPRKEFEVTVISSLLIAAKFIEKDINQPDIQRFTSMHYNYEIDEIDLIVGEIECLGALKYKLNYTVAYDMVSFFLYYGFIFTTEISNKSREYTNIIYCFCKKMINDIMTDIAVICFSPLNIALSVIHWTRKQFGLKPQYFNLIKKWYNVHWSDYKECMDTIKNVLSKLENCNRGNNVFTISHNTNYQSSRSLVVEKKSNKPVNNEKGNIVGNNKESSQITSVINETPNEQKEGNEDPSQKDTEKQSEVVLIKRSKNKKYTRSSSSTNLLEWGKKIKFSTALSVHSRNRANSINMSVINNDSLNEACPQRKASHKLLRKWVFFSPLSKTKNVWNTINSSTPVIDSKNSFKRVHKK